ncbi:MAG: ABC transporter substrate-binding protein [Jiangellaceae bacterium]
MALTSRRLLTPTPNAVSRRLFLRGVGVGGLALAGSGLLSACGTAGTATQSSGDCVSEDLSVDEKVLNFSNWPLYIDVSEDEQSRPTLEAFEQHSGIKVTYTEDVNDNAEFFGKVRNQLAACQSTERDLFVLTDYMAARMVGFGWIQELDKKNLPTVEANLLDNLRSPSWDKERNYSVPWQSGLTGIAYNSAAIGEIGSIDQMLTDPELRGKITFLSELQDTMVFMLLHAGKDPENFTDEDFQLGLDTLQMAVDSGQFRAFTGNEYAQDLVQGNIVAAMAWSGDVIQLQFENPDIKFVAPEEGLSLWSDNMIVPNKATHKANAEALMDHYYDPAVAAELAAWVNYICPVAGAQDEMVNIDPELAENPLIFPTNELLANAHGFMELDEDQDKKYSDWFNQVIGA